MIKACLNTKTKGSLSYLMYQEKDGDFVAVCLNLNIVEYGKDPEKLKKSVEEGALSFLRTVIKKNLPDELLNQASDKKYLEKLSEVEYTKELMVRAHGDKPSETHRYIMPSFIDFSRLPYGGTNRPVLT